MEYTSTRNAQLRAGGAEAIVTGLAPDGGLFVPVGLSAQNFEALSGKSYEQVAGTVLQNLLPQWDAGRLQRDIDASYGTVFEDKAGRLVKLDDKLYSLELWHGPTCAFKDYALQLMPRLLVGAKEICGNNSTTLILVATSGDTGKAALEGFRDVPGTGICVFYPSEGISRIQRLQMDTQEGGNVAVYAVEGNFDDAQRGVKQAFGDEKLAEKLAGRGVQLSSANSINWGRLAPQIVYYVTSYLGLCAEGAVRYGEAVDFCVPTGNFGDILAGYYAKMLGLPVGRLICASNENNVLTDFINTGRYNAKREFYKTSSPSMDILVSSNLERLVYHASGSDELVRRWMAQLAEAGEYRIDPEVFYYIQDHFAADWAGEDAVSREIQDLMAQYNYLCDPHTAVAFHVARTMNRDQSRPVVVLSTASPFKFSEKVLQSLGMATPEDEFEALAALSQKSGMPIPKNIAALQSKPQRFSKTIPAGRIGEIPLELDFLG